MGMYLNKTNIMRLIDGIGVIAYNKSVDAEVLSEVLKVVAEKIEGNQMNLGGKWGKEEWAFMKKVYGMNKFGGRFKGFINFLNNKKYF